MGFVPQKRASFPLIAVFLLLFPFAGLYAGEIDPGFRKALISSGSSRPLIVGHVEAIVYLAERVDLAHLGDSLAAAGAGRRDTHEAVVRALKRKAASTQGPLLDYLKREMARGRVTDVEEFWIANAVWVRCHPEVLFALERRFDVERISPDVAIHLIEPVKVGGVVTASRGEVEPGIRAIGAHLLWAQGVTGRGRLGCNFDTGVDGTHVSMAARWRGLEEGVTPEEAWFDPVTQTDFPFDDGHHGTHTMGTILGIDPERGDSIGVAPEAGWIAAAVIDRVDIETTIQDALAAFQWAVDPDGNPETIDDVPDVVSNSWGISPIFHDVPPCDETFWDAIDAAEAAGVVVVFSAGNEGDIGPMTLRTPADRATTSINAFSVGALLTDQVNIAPYSSRGPSACDSTSPKPEVVAQGDYVRSALNGGGYITLSGTSMACPHAAGAVLLLRQLAPDASSDDIKEALLLAAADLGAPGDDNEYGMGRIDVLEAARLLGDFAVVQGYLYDAGTGDPVVGSVRVAATPIETASLEDGSYSLSLVVGSVYPLEAAAFGYEGATAEVTLDSVGLYRVDFPLEKLPWGSLEGYVTCRSGEAIRGARVEVMGTPVPPAETDESGFYRFESLPADTYFVIGAAAIGFELYRHGVEITTADSVVLDIELEEGFFDNVEEGGAGWTHYPVTPGYGDSWHVSDRRNHSGNGLFSWKCGSVGEDGYGNLLDSALETPTVQLDGNKELLFWHWIDMEIYNEELARDGAVVEMRLNGGQWNLIEPIGGYEYVIGPETGSPFPSGTPCFSGSRGWEPVRFDLRGIEGYARFRFRMGTDGTVSKEGWYIDDIMLTDWRFLELFAAEPEESTVVAGDTLEFGALAQNLTGEEKTFEGRVDVIFNGARRTVMGPRDFALAPYGRLVLPGLGLAVPEWAPPVTVTLELVAVDGQGNEIASDDFPVSIVRYDINEVSRDTKGREFLSHLTVFTRE